MFSHKCIVVFVILAVFIIHDTTNATPVPFFRNDYVFDSETQNFYKIHTIKRNWADAQKRCKLEGAELFVPDSQLDRDVARELVDGKFPRHPELPIYPWVFIGLHDMYSEGEFVTVGGKSINNVFVEWDVSEPNNINNEDCVAMRRNGRMNDLKCDLMLPFICKKSRASIEWNYKCELPDINYVHDKAQGKCYKVHKMPKSWTEAYAICAAELSYLAIINSQSEADYLVQLIAKYPKVQEKPTSFNELEVHLGFQKLFQEEWSTVNGQSLNEVGYARWAPGMPDTTRDERRCGSMLLNGFLKDEDCDNITCTFICEHELNPFSITFAEKISDTASTPSPMPFFRKDYVFKPASQNFYKVHSSARKWVDAIAVCKQELAELFVPVSQIDLNAANEVISEKFPKPPNPTFPWVFIGIHDLFTEGEFMAADDTPVDEVYTDWVANEPNNYQNEDCVSLSFNGKMNDFNCDFELPFICKKSRASVEWNYLCNVPDPSYLYNQDTNTCYKLHLKPRDWTGAYETCYAEQSYLAIINSTTEAQHLVRLIAEAPTANIRGPVGYYPGVAHVGFHNRLLQGWTTVKGQALESTGYTEWAPNQPDNYGGGELCGSIFFDGLLNDMKCSLPCIFICEHNL